jgi:uncharacterized protein
MLWLLFILGAICAGFIQGLTGFAFALIAMSFWIWVLPPQVAAPLVVFSSIWSHLISLRQERIQPVLSKQLYLPYLITGLIGVPVGCLALKFIDAEIFKLLLGIFLLIWAPCMLFKPQISRIQHAGIWTDRCIGFIGGILGGLGGFSGSIPSAWLMLKNLPKQQQRYILRHFNFAIQLLTLCLYAMQGTLSFSLTPYLALIIIFVSIPAMLGARLFYKISEQLFQRIVLGLLFSSGCFLVISALC